MLIAADLLSLSLLLLIAAQDMKRRMIAWWLLPLLLAALVAGGTGSASLREIGIYFLINTLLLLGQFVLLVLWFSLRQRRWMNIVNNAVGLGDLLFLLCMAAAFSPLNFILVYVAGLLLSLAVVAFVRALGLHWKEIPLAGLLALQLAVLLAWRLRSPQLDFYSDEELLRCLNL